MSHTKEKLQDCFEDNCRILGTDSEIIIELTPGKLGVTPKAENIARIIKGWNCHDDLLDACKKTIAIIGIKDITTAKEACKQAIAKAESEV